MKNIIFILSLSLFTMHLFAQDDPVDEYIRIALENNLALKQKNANWEQSVSVLKEAKSLFYPNISLNARYTVADGGRMIDFPVGDLLNPVYSTLNALTASSDFPTIENESFPFFRPTEHETKLRLIQPILNTDIYYNRKIKENLSTAEFADLQSYKNSLVAEVKKAYYEYLKMLEIRTLMTETRLILEENVRLSQSLFKNDKVTRDIVLRSQAELQELEEKNAGVEKGLKVSQSYFNFLLNRSFDEEILTSVPRVEEIPASLIDLKNNAMGSRQELEMLQAYITAAENKLRLDKASRVPDLFAVIDYGYQGEKYQFTNEDDFMMASFVLTWDLFKGFENRNKSTQSQINLDKLKIQKEETSRLIELEVTHAWYELLELNERLLSSESRVKTERQIFKMVSSKYKQGQANQLDFIAARNSMTGAEQELIISKYDYMISYAEFEKAVAGSSFIKNMENDEVQ